MEPPQSTSPSRLCKTEREQAALQLPLDGEKSAQVGRGGGRGGGGGAGGGG